MRPWPSIGAGQPSGMTVRVIAHGAELLAIGSKPQGRLHRLQRGRDIRRIQPKFEQPHVP